MKFGAFSPTVAIQTSSSLLRYPGHSTLTLHPGRVESPREEALYGCEENLTDVKIPSLIREDSVERDVPEGTLGTDEELWLADPASMRLGGGC